MCRWMIWREVSDVLVFIIYLYEGLVKEMHVEKKEEVIASDRKKVSVSVEEVSD